MRKDSILSKILTHVDCQIKFKNLLLRSQSDPDASEVLLKSKNESFLGHQVIDLFLIDRLSLFSSKNKLKIQRHTKRREWLFLPYGYHYYRFQVRASRIKAILNFVFLFFIFSSLTSKLYLNTQDNIVILFTTTKILEGKRWHTFIYSLTHTTEMR